MDQSHRKAWEVIGYDEFLGEPLKAHERAAAFLSNLPDRPFFLSVGFLETHREFPDLENAIDDPKYSLPPAPLPDTPATRQDVVRFKASARILDQKMGFVLDALERNGLADNTLVVCTTDHGIAFPRMKCNLHDSGTGVMLVMRGPGGFSGGKAIDAMTNHLDLFPTICDLLQIEPPDRLRGKSLLPLVRGEIDEIHEELFAEVTYHAAYEPMRSVRTKRWKYIKRFERRTKPVLPNCDDGESKSFWLENGWSEMNPPDEMLFDLVFDPSETNNLAAQPTCPGILENMRARLYRWMRETNDPLLHGPVCPPPTARVNDPDGLSPGEKTISSQPEAAADADKLHR
jgi:arylsulfatase A-like enzyme